MPLSSLPAEERRQILDGLWQHGLFGMALVREDHTFIRANPAFCAIVEYSEAELQKMTFGDITVGADQAADAAMAARVATGEIDSYDMTKTYFTKTRRAVQVILRVVPVRIGDEFQYFVSQIAPSQTAAPVVGPAPPEVKRLKAWEQAKANWPTITSMLAALGAGIAAFYSVLTGGAG